jgi:hypothetical protein
VAQREEITMVKAEQNKEVESSGRQPYEPPRADFVPLKIEERLMACNKTVICMTPAAS